MSLFSAIIAIIINAIVVLLVVGTGDSVKSDGIDLRVNSYFPTGKIPVRGLSEA